MILKALTLENFKGIREPVRIEFAPLTLLFGPNNAGKSTITQALMYAQEIFDRNNCDAGRTVLGGDVIDLGGFRNLVYKHDLSRIIRMRFELDLRDTKLPQNSDWLREAKIDANMDEYEDSPKRLSFRSWEKLVSSISDIWIEIEIAWRDCSTVQAAGPVVQKYSIGKAQDIYSAISLNSKGEASISTVNFGAPPFGTTYTRQNESDISWVLSQLARQYIHACIEQTDQPDLGLQRGAFVCLPGENVCEDSNALSRDEFDRLIGDIVAGNGDWGNASVETESGEQNPLYKYRHVLLNHANIILSNWGQQSSQTPLAIKLSGTDTKFMRVLKKTEQLRAAAAIGNNQTDLEEDLDPKEFAQRQQERISDSLRTGLIFDSWFPDIFDALIHDEFVPVGAGRALPLNLRGTAIPELGKTLEPHPKVWLPQDEKVFTNEFYENPMFAQEHFNDLLTCLISGPRELLHNALVHSLYVSPFREMPPRHYQPARSPDPRRWANGLAAWDSIMLRGREFAKAVNHWLSDEKRFDSRLSIDLCHYHELDVDSPLLTSSDEEPQTELSLISLRDRLRQLPQGRRLQIKDLRNGITLFPQDLGVGISQVIPVIVAALHNESGIVMIEEPESNIHPAFQVVLADLFITQGKANPGVMFLIETHSEHLMLRCLRRIRETGEGEVSEGEPSLKPEDIAVHFVEPGDDGPHIHRIRIDEDGEFLDAWPQGFFRERGKELFG